MNRLTGEAEGVWAWWRKSQGGAALHAKVGECYGGQSEDEWQEVNSWDGFYWWSEGDVDGIYEMTELWTGCSTCETEKCNVNLALVLTCP